MGIQSYNGKKIILLLLIKVFTIVGINAQEIKIPTDTINNNIYFVGVYQMDSMKIIEDKKTHYFFISDCSMESVEKISSKDSKYLLRSGWNLVM